MKTTLNPFENSKRTANGTGGGVSPAVIEEMQAEISILGSQNKTQAQDITDIKGSLNSINDNLAGFKFYPTGTNLVALISDDSFYTDANDKYVVWGTATANQLVEDNPNTYKSVPSTEDCRGEVGADTVSPFKNKVFITNYPSDYKYQGELLAGKTVTLTIPNNISYLVFVSEQYWQRLAVYDTKSRKFLFLGCMINIYPIKTNYQIVGNTLKVTNQSSDFKVWYMGI